MADTLAEEMRLHLAEPFPSPWRRDWTMAWMPSIGADIYGWATKAGSLSDLDRSRLREAADELHRSIAALPLDAQPYYERILRIARLTLAV